VQSFTGPSYGALLRGNATSRKDGLQGLRPRARLARRESSPSVFGITAEPRKTLTSHATWHPSTQDNRESDGAWRGFCSASALGPSAKVAQAPPTVCKGPWAMAPSLVDRHLQSSHGGVFDFLGALKIEKTPQSHPMASGRVFTGNTDESPPP